MPITHDIIGNITIVRLVGRCEKNRKEIADTIMGIHRNVKTVLAQVGSVNGEFRTCELERIGGEDQSVTVHVESKCRFFVDVKACYFSPIDFLMSGCASHSKLQVERLW